MLIFYVLIIISVFLYPSSYIAEAVETIDKISQSIDLNGNTETITQSYYIDLLKNSMKPSILMIQML